MDRFLVKWHDRIARFTPWGFIADYRRLKQRVYTKRWAALEDIAVYLETSCVSGDYCEFGVWTGNTFTHAAALFQRSNPQMRFMAFDSFEGLPPTDGIDAGSGFYQGQYACDQAGFERGLRRAHIDQNRVEIVPGWFDVTLTPETARRINLKNVAVAWIDADLYSSTVPILKFIRPFITEGTVLVFDDWRVFRNDPTKGEQRACAEWVSETGVELAELFSFNGVGAVFVVRRC
jgi:hypothetical protein